MSDFPVIDNDANDGIPFTPAEPVVSYDEERVSNIVEDDEEDEVEEVKLKENQPVPKPAVIKRPSLLRVRAASQAAPDHWINNKEVKVLQQRLKDKGHKLGSIDGKYGQKTRDAVKDFQQQTEGLNETGVADRATIVQLFK